MGELHLDILVDRLKREFKVEANIGAPQVAYRETVSNEAEIDYTHKKQSGGAGQFARVKLIISPTDPGEGYSFESKIVGGAVPKEYIPGVEKGIQSVMDSGPLAGTGGSARDIRKVAAMRDLQILNERSEAENLEEEVVNTSDDVEKT